MRIGILILMSFIMTFNSHSQKSNLGLASHEFQYFGDSLKLKKIIVFLQSDSIQVIAQKDQICEFKILDLGTTKSKKFSVYHIEYGIGISCQGVVRTIFFKGENLIGYYNSDIASPDLIDMDKLIWKYESGKSEIMDLSNEIPDKFLFGDFQRELKKN